jgi:hypothetical protein
MISTLPTLAATALTLGAIPGNNTVSATSSGLNGSPITFSAVGTSRTSLNPHYIYSISGNSQSGLTGQSLSSPFVVLMIDDYYGLQLTKMSATDATNDYLRGGNAPTGSA